MLDFGFLQRTGFTNPESSGKTEGHDRRCDGMEKHMDKTHLQSYYEDERQRFLPMVIVIRSAVTTVFLSRQTVTFVAVTVIPHTVTMSSSVWSSDIMYVLLYENLQCLKSCLQLFLVIILLGNAFEFPTNYQPSPPVQKECGFSLWVPESPPAPCPAPIHNTEECGFSLWAESLPALVQLWFAGYFRDCCFNSVS